MTELFRSSVDEIISSGAPNPDPDPDPDPTPTGTMTGGDGTTGGTTDGSRNPEPPVRTGNGAWDAEQADIKGAGGRITLVTTYGSCHPSFTKSYQFVNAGNAAQYLDGSGNQRTELVRPLRSNGSQISATRGTTQYLAFSLFLPTGFIARLTDNMTFVQMHQPSGGTQPTRLRLEPSGRFAARFSRPPGFTSGTNKLGTKVAQENGHILFVMKCVWSDTNTGSVDVYWANPGETAFTHDISLSGPNQGGNSGYWKCGGYFAAATQIASATNPMVWAMSNIIFGESFAAVASRAFGVTMI